jgi:hypothetical protein
MDFENCQEIASVFKRYKKDFEAIPKDRVKDVAESLSGILSDLEDCGWNYDEFAASIARYHNARN